ncbi:MAG: hypothetical protein WC473_02045 [Patescibacteria group bacterium]
MTTHVAAPAMAAACPFYANEEVQSNYGYPQGYAVKPIAEQLVALSRHLPNLDASSALNSSKELPILPSGAERWFAVPKFEKVGKDYNDAVERVIDIIGKTRTLYNFRKGKLDEKYLRLTERTAVALQMLGEKQKGDFLLIPAQFGFSHRGRSVRRVRVVYAPGEFGLGSFIVGCMLIAHPERLVQCEQLHIDCPGDEYALVADGDFSESPCFCFGFDGGRGLVRHALGPCPRPLRFGFRASLAVI